MTGASEQQALQIGTTLGGGRFVLHELLGEGGAAQVYRAEDLQLGRSVALKLLLERYVGRPERERRLLDEAEYLRRIGPSRHVVALVDAGRLDDCGGRPFVATELLQGTTLGQQKLVERSRALSLRRVCLVARQIAEAVRTCHRAGVVHRDLTPANVMLLADASIEEGNRVVLFDFSHAGASDGPRLQLGHPDRLTRPHEVPGTPKHMSPEQARAEPASSAMDVYAFGVLLWELVTGENPFGQVRERQQFIELQRRGALETPRMMGWTYAVPDSLAELINGCLHVDPELRPDMNRLIKRLDRLLVELEVALPVESTVTMTAPLARVPADRLGAWGPPPKTPTLTDETLADEATERRDFAPPIQPVFARPHAAELAPALPEISPVEEISSASEITRTGPPKPNLRGRVLVVLLLGVAAITLAIWLSRDRQPPEIEAPQAAGGTALDPRPVAPDPAPLAVQPLPPTPSPSEATSPEPTPTAEAPAPEPEAPEAEAPAPEPKPKPEPKPPIEPPPLASVPAYEQPECIETRESAEAALAAGEWNRADRLARKSKCWADATVRLRIRVQALAQTENYEECMQAGDGLEDKEIKRWVNICRRAQQ